jgi:hypothetical protein
VASLVTWVTGAAWVAWGSRWRGSAKIAAAARAPPTSLMVSLIQSLAYECYLTFVSIRR